MPSTTSFKYISPFISKDCNLPGICGKTIWKWEKKNQQTMLMWGISQSFSSMEMVASSTWAVPYPFCLRCQRSHLPLQDKEKPSNVRELPCKLIFPSRNSKMLQFMFRLLLQFKFKMDRTWNILFHWSHQLILLFSFYFHTYLDFP